MLEEKEKEQHKELKKKTEKKQLGSFKFNFVDRLTWGWCSLLIWSGLDKVSAGICWGTTLLPNCLC